MMKVSRDETESKVIRSVAKLKAYAPGECWKDVPGHPTRAVSNTGRVLMFPHRASRRGRRFGASILEPSDPGIEFRHPWIRGYTRFDHLILCLFDRFPDPGEKSISLGVERLDPSFLHHIDNLIWSSDLAIVNAMHVADIILEVRSRKRTLEEGVSERIFRDAMLVICEHASVSTKNVYELAQSAYPSLSERVRNRLHRREAMLRMAFWPSSSNSMFVPPIASSDDILDGAVRLRGTMVCMKDLVQMRAMGVPLNEFLKSIGVHMKPAKIERAIKFWRNHESQNHSCA